MRKKIIVDPEHGKAMLELYHSGLGYYRVAKHFPYTPTIVRQYLYENGDYTLYRKNYQDVGCRFKRVELLDSDRKCVGMRYLDEEDRLKMVKKQEMKKQKVLNKLDIGSIIKINKKEYIVKNKYTNVILAESNGIKTCFRIDDIAILRRGA